MRALAFAATMAVLAVCGCASATPASQWALLGERPAEALAADEPAAPPRGLIAYCARAQQECGVAPRARLRPAASFAPRSASEARFQTLLTLSASMAAPDRAEGARVALDPQRLADLFEVNQAINRAILFAPDREIYGVSENWSRPLAGAAPGAQVWGDCEDYALEKRAALIARGWDEGVLQLAVAQAPGFGLHAVLIVATDHGDLVLDNGYETPRPLETLPYRWLSRQSGPSLMSWTRTHAAPLPPQRTMAPLNLYARLSAEGATP